MSHTESETPPKTVSVDDMLATGATYRQLDYWCTQGYLRPEQTKRGRGFNRDWPPSERDVARVIVRLLAVGVELAAAAKIAREIVGDDATRVDLGDGVVLSLEDAV
jgi:hypothetical protein